MKKVEKKIYLEGRDLGLKGKVLDNWVKDKLRESPKVAETVELVEVLEVVVKKRGRPKKDA